MMQPSALSVELQTLILSEVNLPAEWPISASTEIVEGLKIEGTDCEDLMEAFFIRFNIERGDYEFRQYFLPEEFLHPFPSVAKWLYKAQMAGIDLHEEREPLTLGMLQHAIELGLWDTEKLRLFDQQFRLPLSLESFIIEYIGTKIGRRPSRYVKVNDDALLTSFDPARMMKEFFERFDVGQGDYNFHRYFEKAGFKEPTPLLKRLFGRKKHLEADKMLEPLTLGMLQHAIELRVWDTERLRAFVRGDNSVK